MQTYLERDVRAITAIRDLATFRRFLALVASRTGQILNKTDLAGPLGASVPTMTEWLHILEVTGQIIIVPPYFENFGKRLVKSPKIYLMDQGLACHLLGIETAPELARSPFLGAIFEGFIASEILKHQVNHGRAREIYYFRDQQGLEVDFVVPTRSRHLVLIEAKATQTPTPGLAKPLRQLAAAIAHPVTPFVVHRPAGATEGIATLGPGVRAGGIRELLDILG
ncbi:MAG: DUF4143 domain-containing protein [Gemmataceae bacterium]